MPPNNVGYFHAAYIVAIGIYALYVVSLWWRGRKLTARLRAMREHEAASGSA